MYPQRPGKIRKQVLARIGQTRRYLIRCELAAGFEFDGFDNSLATEEEVGQRNLIWTTIYLQNEIVTGFHQTRGNLVKCNASTKPQHISAPTFPQDILATGEDVCIISNATFKPIIT